MTLVRRPPWLAGLLLLVLCAGLVVPLAAVFGAARWPYLVGLAALLLVAFGALERLWQQRSLPRAYRVVKRRRFRLVPGGKKGNGHADEDPDGTEDKPRWVM
jgi:protein-S-isoprenylcysteine O-methyltransferase Ste14